MSLYISNINGLSLVFLSSLCGYFTHNADNFRKTVVKENSCHKSWRYQPSKNKPRAPSINPVLSINFLFSKHKSLGKDSNSQFPTLSHQVVKGGKLPKVNKWHLFITFFRKQLTRLFFFLGFSYIPKANMTSN